MTTSLRKPYLTDLSDSQWQLIAPHIVLSTGGAPKTTDVRVTVNAVFYQLRTGFTLPMSVTMA